ncbi:MAG: CHAT domain-containing tetratricopeptide repeat protein [Cyanobacteriota bacterium]
MPVLAISMNQKLMHYLNEVSPVSTVMNIITTTIKESSFQLQLKTEANQVLNLGIELIQVSHYQAAIQSLLWALILYRTINNMSGEAASLYKLGEAYHKVGESQQAIERYKQLLTIAEEKSDYLYKAHALEGLGIVYRTQGEYQCVSNYHQQSLRIYQHINDYYGQAMSLVNLGIVYYYLGEYLQAIDSCQQCLNISNPRGYRSLEAKCWGIMGTTYHDQGQYPKAVKCCEQSLSIARDIGNFWEQGAALDSLGKIFNSLGQYQKAIENYKQSLSIAQERHTPYEEAASLGNIGSAFYALGQYPEAEKYYNDLFVIANKINHPHFKAAYLNALGAVYHQQRKYSKAIKSYKKSLRISRKTDYIEGELSSLGNLGNAFCALKQYSKSIEYYQKSLAIAQKINDRAREADTLNNLGFALLKSHRLAEAEKTLRAAMEVKESLRGGLKDAHKVSIFDTQLNTYRLLQEVLILQNKHKDALEIAERGRARAFVELLYERSFPKPEGIIEPPTFLQIQKIAQHINCTLVEYSVIEIDDLLLIWVIKPTGEITFRSLHLQPLRQEQNISLSDLVSQSRESLGVKEETLRSATPTTTQKTPQLIRYINEPLRQLHQYLIEPIASFLPTDPNTPVIFIPQGALFLVPFSALQDATGKFLIEQHIILTAPSIQVLDLTHQQRQRVATNHQLPLQSQDVLVVGNPTMPTIPLREPLEPLPPLPGSEAEAIAIASLLNTQAIIGDKATKVDIVQQMPKARLIHLATHGLLDDIKQLGVPGAIALAPSDNDNGFLTAGEIMEMFGQPQNSPLQAELIVLSACVTGLGKITGDGVIGLSRCLMAAGVSRLIVSLWPVSDLATAFLMIQFHKILNNLPQLKPGDAAKALNHAQKWLLNLTSEEAEQELEKLKPYIYQAYAGRSKRVAEVRINRYLKDIRDRTPYPFANPVYWSAFTTIGL